MSERNDRVGITEELADRVSSQTEFLVRIHEEFQDIFRGIAIELEEVRRALGLFSSGVARGTMSELRELSPREWEVLRELINGHRNIWDRDRAVHQPAHRSESRKVDLPEAGSPLAA